MDMEKIKINIGKKVKTLRLEHKLTQEQLAEYVDKSREHISCIENGKHLPTLDTMFAFAEYFKVDIKEFF